MSKIVVLLLVMYGVVCHGRHVQRRSLVHTEGQMMHDNSEVISDIDGIPIDVLRNLKPNRFVPINSILFFKTYPPCEPGFERDVIGVCREVWE